MFVGELVRLLVAEGRLEEAAGVPWKASIPQGMREVIARRLHRLTPDCNHLLSQASVLGREFRLDALAQMSEQPGDELLDLLDEALAARVVGELPGGRRGGLRFSHALIRDALYSELGRKQRLKLHRRAAEALETVHGGQSEAHPAELAHHYLEAASGGGTDKAIQYARKAADRAAGLLAFEEAARLYRMALEALALAPQAVESMRCDLLLALGDAQSRGGDLAAAKETFVQAAEVARHLDASEHLARAALGYGGRFVWFRAGNDRRLIPLLEDAIEALPVENPLRARLLARLAGALRDHPVPERRAALTRDAVALARTTGDRATLAYALEGTYAALSVPRDADAWLAMAKELGQLADEAGDDELAYMSHLHAWGALMVRGDLHAAEREFATATAVAQELRQPALQWSQAMAQANRALFAGRFDEAHRLIERVELGRVGNQVVLGGEDETTFQYVARLQNWALRREHGRLEEARESIERYVAEYPSFFIFRCVLANLYSQLGRVADAQVELDRLGADSFVGLEVGTEWHFGANLLAEVCARLADSRHAVPLYDVLLPYSDCNVWAHAEFSLGSASRYLGLLASTTSRWQQAVLHFECALEMNASMATRPWVAHTQEDYARMLLARDRAGDRKKACELITTALATYRELGMMSWADSASRLQQTLKRGPENER